MADDHKAQGQNIQSHAATYAGLINLLFYGAIAVFVIAACIVWLIAPAAK